MAYTKTAWVNDSAPHIDAANLNKIEQGIKDAHDTAFTETKVLATQLTGLTLVSSEVSSTDSVLVAFGKLQSQIKDGGGGGSHIESFDVPVTNGWQANIDAIPSSIQVFKKQKGTVISNGVYLVQTPLTAGTIIATLPVGLRPAARVKGTAFALAASVLTPVNFYIETSGVFGVVSPPTAQFTLFLDLVYFV